MIRSTGDVYTLLYKSIILGNGYIAPKEAFLRGGYETTTANWSKFVPEALDLIVAASLDTLKSVFE